LPQSLVELRHCALNESCGERLKRKQDGLRLFQRALELDDPPLSAADEGLVEARLAEHHADPSSSVPLDEMTCRLRVQNRER
jgi:hypothetical protein